MVLLGVSATYRHWFAAAGSRFGQARIKDTRPFHFPPFPPSLAFFS